MKEQKTNHRIKSDGSRNRGRKALSVLAAAVIMTAALLAGCSRMPSFPGLPGSKPTAVSLAKDAADNLQRAESFSMHMDMNTDFAMTYQVLDISANAGIDIGMDMDMIRNPDLAKGTLEMQVDAVGQKESMQGEFYLDPSEGEDGTTYVRWSGGEWMKKTGSKKSAGSERPVVAAAASGIFPESILEGADLFKLIAEQAQDAELKEETVEVNGEEAWQINTNLQGPLLRELLQKSDTKMPFDINDVDWDKVGIPSQIYIYKESILPARMVLDCKDLGPVIFGDLLDQTTSKVPVEDIKIEISGCMIDLTFTNYDEVKRFKIPQEARDAASSDSLMPDALDMIGG